MKITSIAEGVTVEGKHVHTMPKNVLPNVADIEHFYGYNQTNPWFRHVWAEQPLDRIVILKDNGGYVIVPRDLEKYSFED